MCADCQRRAVTNPLRVLDCKVPEDQPIIDTLPSILDHLCADCHAHFDVVQEHLDAARHPLRSPPAPGARPRLLHAHDVRDHARRARRAELRARRRPLRRPGGIARLEGPRARHRLLHRRRPPGDERRRSAPSTAARPLDVFLAPMGDAAEPHAGELAAELARGRHLASKLGRPQAEAGARNSPTSWARASR